MRWGAVGGGGGGGVELRWGAEDGAGAANYVVEFQRAAGISAF